MTIDPKDDRALEMLFAGARDTAPEMDASLVDRLLPPEAEPVITTVADTTRSRFRDWLPAFGGLGLATAIGVWIGVAVPLDTLLNVAAPGAVETLDLSAFFAGADPLVFFSDETGL